MFRKRMSSFASTKEASTQEAAVVGGGQAEVVGGCQAEGGQAEVVGTEIITEIIIPKDKIGFESIYLKEFPEDQLTMEFWRRLLTMLLTQCFQVELSQIYPKLTKLIEELISFQNKTNQDQIESVFFAHLSHEQIWTGNVKRVSPLKMSFEKWIESAFNVTYRDNWVVKKTRFFVMIDINKRVLSGVEFAPLREDEPYYNSQKGENQWMISNCCTAEDCRGKNHMTNLLKKVIKDFYDNSTIYLEIWTGGANKEQLKTFYKKFGFQELKTIGTSLWMRRHPFGAIEIREGFVTKV